MKDRLMRGAFITGTDTDVGKTMVTVSLAAALAEYQRVQVIKPVQTGCKQTADSKNLYAPDVAAAQSIGVDACAIRSYLPPCSPHLAAELASEKLICAELGRAVCRKMRENSGVISIVEGAGGVLVPLNQHETMLDLMFQLNLPVLLVVAHRLGCINHALLNLELLKSRGVKLLGMVLNRVSPPQICDVGCGSDAHSEDEERILVDNFRMLTLLGRQRKVPLLANIPYLDRQRSDWSVRAKDALRRVIEQICNISEESIPDCASSQHQTEKDILEFDRKHLWHPYTSVTNPLLTREVVATHDNRLVLADGRELIDGMSSWWCAIHGYNHPRLIAAMTKQLEVMSHVMFGGITHRPAVELGRRLLSMVPAGLEYIFYADSGSVSVEVALKMAIQYQLSIGQLMRQHFAVPMGGYHGDTTGAMSVCDPVNGMHGLFTGLFAKHYFVERPSCRFDQPYDDTSLDGMRTLLAQRHNEIAAVILEPIVQGAGGMWFYHPKYLAGVRELCDQYGVLLIADEIATGFGRTGRLFACDWARVLPDIICVGKGLTGGMMTGGAVLTTRKVAEGIGRADAAGGGGILMHGPTFMANPLFCSAACASLDLLMSCPWQKLVLALEKELKTGLAPCLNKPGVKDLRVLGAIGVVETVKPIDVQRLQEFFVQRGVWIRPFGFSLYVMPPYTTPKTDIRKLCAAICAAVDQGLIL